MKYMLLMYADESIVSKFTTEEFQATGQAWQAYSKDSATAGVLLSGGGLAPVADATTVRVRNDKTLTTDGPFAETHEQLAGCHLVECKDLDEAIAWAARVPTAKYGSVEVRPLWSQQ